MPNGYTGVIRIDRDVWGALQKLAEPLVETPNDVLRRVLGLGRKAAPKGGFRRGGQAAAIDAALPGTIEELVKETHLPEGRVRRHCKHWVERGYYIQDEGGRYRRAE